MALFAFDILLISMLFSSSVSSQTQYLFTQMVEARCEERVFKPAFILDDLESQRPPDYQLVLVLHFIFDLREDRALLIKVSLEVLAQMLTFR